MESDIRHYLAWYHVSDIFLDEVPSGPGGLGYYRDLARYIHRLSPGSTVMLNPGTYPAEQYMSVGDVVLVFEGSYASYRALRVPGWVRDYPASKFAQSVYGTPRSRLAAVIGLSRRRHAGYVYVTGSGGRNPYRTLPAYWPSEDAIVTAGCPATAASATGRAGATRPAPGGT